MNDIDEASGFIAVIGMAVRVPGANDLDGFWANLVGGVDSVTRFDGAGDQVSAFGLVTAADEFDAGLFGYAPKEALLMDPQHRVFLECAWEALEHAGYDPSGYPGKIGVYGGSGDTGYGARLLANRDRFPGVSEWQLRLAAGADFLTSRVSYKLGLRGPAITVQTACSTSLVAVHIATQALIGGECDVALAGGVTIHVPTPVDEFGADGRGVLAVDGRCRAFDAVATGTVASDGAGIVVLKRLDDALADGDHVHAVLRGSAVTNDGAGKVGFTAPSVDGQAAAIAEAHLVAGVEPAEIGYVEAHGTGTPVGDPIEVRALTKAFERAGQTLPEKVCVLGSVKTNIGHTDAASGVLGMIKAVLAVEHELIPGTVHFTAPNPRLDLDTGPFTVTSRALPWPRTDTPRLAGINSLGIGGTNAHVVIEEAPRPVPAELGRPYQLLPLSARGVDTLSTMVDRIVADLPDNPAEAADIAWTLQTGRHAFAHRGFVVAETRGGSRSVSIGEPAQARSAPPVAFLFPGQGGQHVGMAKELYEHEPVFARELDRCAELAATDLGVDLRSVVYPEPGGEHAAEVRLAAMSLSQPALFAVQVALARLWRSWGVRPSVVLGHSLGAYAAATVAGVLDLPDALTLVLTRSKLLDGLPSGAMLAVGLAEDALLPRLRGQVSIAAINGPAQCVVTGPAEDIAALHEILAGEGVDTRPLRISAAAHSQLVEPVVPLMEKAAAGVALRAPNVPWISDHTGAPVDAEEVTNPAYWGGHLRHTVRFHDALTRLLADNDGPLLEIGPGRTLGTLAQQHREHTDNQPTVASLPHAVDPRSAGSAMMAAAGRLWQAGVPVEFAALHEGRRPRRVPLPTYPFDRQRFNIDHPEAPTPEPSQGQADTSPEQPATTPTEQALASAFGQVLGITDIGTDDNFFELGGDSLMAAQIVVLARTALGTEVSVAMILRAPTVAGLARLIDEQGQP